MFSLLNMPPHPRRPADGDGSSLTASLSDAHGEDSPLPTTYNEEAGEGEAQETDANGVDGALEEEGVVAHAENEDEHQLAGGDGDGGEEVAGGEGEVAGVDGDAARGADPPGASGEGGDADPLHDPGGAGAGEEEERRPLDGDLSPQDVLAELSLEGTKALEGGGSYSSLSDGGDTAGATTAATSAEAVIGVAEESAEIPSAARTSSVARSLFGFEGKDGGKGKGARAKNGDADGGSSDDLPVVPSKEEIKLQSR